MLQLPSRPSLICLRGFILSIGFMLLMLAGLLSVLVNLSVVLMFAAAAMVLMIACMARPQLGLILYKVWNRLARYFAAFSRMYLMAMCYILIIFPVGKLCSTLRLTPPSPSESMWVPRRSVDPRAYRSLYGAGGDVQSIHSSSRSFISWALQTDNLWACALLPLLILLSLLETEKEAEVSSDIYTLF